MSYTIGQVAEMTGISISTLRYYDREGMFPEMARTAGGVRVFSDREIGVLRVIDCLKASGMSIRDIKQFLGWCREGNASLQRRRDLFYSRLEEVQKQMAALEETMNRLRYKCWYYDTALAAGTEEAVKSLPAEAVPAELRTFKI